MSYKTHQILVLLIQVAQVADESNEVALEPEDRVPGFCLIAIHVGELAS
jgi:hypothetical protein